jgi:bisphosphoglycerate-dependent phosphoglycerate mutase
MVIATGHSEALAAGKVLKEAGLQFDVAHTSTLKVGVERRGRLHSKPCLL